MARAKGSDLRGEEEGGAEAGAARRRFPLPQLSLSLSAFIMSLTITLISAFYAIQGAEILVRAPEQVILYRDGTGDDSILSFAVRIDMINSASDYGDVMLEAELTPSAGAPSFKYQATVNPVFTSSAFESAKNCALGSRCIGLQGLLLVEQSDQLADLPGGSARALTFSFPVTEWNCSGSRSACNRYGTFDKAVSAVTAAKLNIKIILHFHSDGDRQISCRGSNIDAGYLRQVGWISLSCDQSKVTGEHFL